MFDIIFPKRRPAFNLNASHTVDELKAERARLLDEKAEAQSALAQLKAKRQAVQLYEKVDALIEHDKEIDRQQLVISQFDTKIARVDAKLEAIEADLNSHWRHELYETAKNRLADGKAALAAYEKHASAAADALLKYKEIHDSVVAANANLPRGKVPLADPEPRNGAPGFSPKPKPPGTYTVDDAPRVAIPHVSVLTRAALPKIGDRNAYYFGAENISGKRKK